ncbi:MAG: hypothetical protein H5T66_09680, partial [Chloroflexi bacterium]|nr:hypothetical protein [Chloroflexota bacterium]
MNAKQRFLTALDRSGLPDRLPVTTHHLMRYFLDTYMGGMDNEAFFDYFGLDPIRWILPYRADEAAGEYLDPEREDPLQPCAILTDTWQLKREVLQETPERTVRYYFVTPRGTLTMMTASNVYTTWVIERLIKEKRDIDLLAEYWPAPKCDVEAVNREAERYGDRGLIRGSVASFPIYGQGGCWQDAACLVGIERLIMETYDDPLWVRTLLGILQSRKAEFIASLEGARFDLLETGGGDASSTVISPRIFDRFVAPYDAPLIALAHEKGQRIVYHTCGGMMPFLERIADMEPDAMETFTPPGMGGDVDLAEAKRRIGHRVCFIGGWDQYHYFLNCSEEETRAEVRRCFQAAGEGGGYILAPSDHFFDADPRLIAAFADEARRCVYS